MQALRITDLRKKYGDHDVLCGVDLCVEEGSFTALLGHNGAGKTTTLGIVAGLIRKTSGSVSVFDHYLDSDPVAVKSCIGLMTQDYNFSQFETVEQVVLNQAGFFGIRRSDARKRADRLFDIMDLQSLRHAETRELSGGMKKRMMLVRAVITEPRLLILDEPTAGVDIEIRHLIWNFLRELNRSGTTVLLTTHYFEEVENLCQQVAILKNGVISDGGYVHELISRLTVRSVIFGLSCPLPADCYLPLTPLDGNYVEYTYDSKKTNVSEMVTALLKYGCSVLSVRNRSSSLEEYFLNQRDEHCL